MTSRDTRLLVSIGVGAVGGAFSGWLTGMWEAASLADGMAAAIVGGLVGSVAGGLTRLGWRWLGA